MEYLDHHLLRNRMQEENTYQSSNIMYTFFEGLDKSAVIRGSFNDENQLGLCWYRENVWVYIYILIDQKKKKKTRHITLYFHSR